METVCNVSKCGICLLEFKDPKILPCFHTFCAKCLEANLSANEQKQQSQRFFSCPMCRKLTEIPKGGIKAFQTNFYVKSDNDFVSEFDCDACDRKQKGSRKCNECLQTFCEQCSVIHSRTSATRNHQLHNIVRKIEPTNLQETVQARCQTHQREYVSICEECDAICCEECVMSTHNNHQQRSLESSAAEKRTALRNRIDQLQQRVEEMEHDACALQKQNEVKFHFFSDETEHLRMKKNSLVKKINDIFAQFEIQIGNKNEEQKMQADQLIEAQLLKCRSIKEIVNESMKILETGNDVGLLESFGALSKKLSTDDTELVNCVPGHALMENVEKCSSWLIRMEKTCDENM